MRVRPYSPQHPQEVRWCRCGHGPPRHEGTWPGRVARMGPSRVSESCARCALGASGSWCPLCLLHPPSYRFPWNVLVPPAAFHSPCHRLGSDLPISPGSQELASASPVPVPRLHRQRCQHGALPGQLRHAPPRGLLRLPQGLRGLRVPPRPCLPLDRVLFRHCPLGRPTQARAHPGSHASVSPGTSISALSAVRWRGHPAPKRPAGPGLGFSRCTAPPGVRCTPCHLKPQPLPSCQLPSEPLCLPCLPLQCSPSLTFSGG